MRREDFACPNAGRLVQTQDSAWSFVPAPLPPRIEYDGELVLALSQADAALAELSALGRQLPNPHLLIQPYMGREAVLSSRIEGTQASLSDIFLDEMQDESHSGENDVREVRNYIRALENGIERLRDLPLSLRLVRELHMELMAGVRGFQKQPGEFRASQNFIGLPGCTLQTASFVPPTVPEMHAALHEWELFLHRRDEFPDLIQCALMHVQFETIHPFLDGNGRIGRLLITLFLIERGRLSQPLLYLSAFIEAHKADYYSLLQRTRTHCEWRPWLVFFLNGVRTIAQDAARQAKELFDLREAYRQHLARHTNALTLLDALFLNPYLTARRAARILEKSDPTARLAISLLEEHGVLEEVSGREWGRFYVARPILEAIDRPLP